MKRTALALAAVIAATGLATAKDAHVSKPHAPAACIETSQKLDCGTTASISRDPNGAPVTTSATKAQPRLGIDVNPWIVPTFN